jgi:peroxiredoxin
LARLRDDYSEFTRRNAEVLAVGPDSADAFQRYWTEHKLPFPGMPDPGHRVAGRYQQEVNLFKLGRMPLLIVLDQKGLIRYIHRASSMSDIPDNPTLLSVIDEILTPAA